MIICEIFYVVGTPVHLRWVINEGVQVHELVCFSVTLQEIFNGLGLFGQKLITDLPFLDSDRIAYLFAALELVALGEISIIVTILVDHLLIESNLHGFLAIELRSDLLFLSISVAEHVKSVAQQPCLKVLIALVGHIENSR